MIKGFPSNSAFNSIYCFTCKNLSEEDLRKARLLWEFPLRRNEVYKRDYYESGHKELFIKGEESKEILVQNSAKDLRGIEFCKKWKIMEPLNPEKSFERLLKDRIEQYVSALAFDEPDSIIKARRWAELKLYHILMGAYDAPIDYEDETYKLPYGLPNDFYVSGKLMIEINLNNSIDSIKKEFEKKLDYWKNEYRRQKPKIDFWKNLESSERRLNYYWDDDNEDYKPKGGIIEVDILKELEKMKAYEKNKTRRSNNKRKKPLLPLPLKKHFDKYDDYLKIWDMREQYDPPTFKEIGRGIYPKKPIKQSEDLARKNFYATYRLIYGQGYRYQNVKKARKELKKEHLAISCDMCPQKDTCKDLCPAVIGYIEQDQVKAGRVLLLSEVKYSKE